jgi:hypothetical protein
MAEIGEALQGVASGALNVGITILIALIVGGFVIAAVFLLLKWRRYNQFKCVIWEKDAFGQTKQTEDSAGVFVDRKTKNKRFFMQKAYVGLEPDNIPYIQSGRKKIVYLYRTGLKNFQFIKPVLADNPGVSFSVGEEDVNWAVNAYDRQKKLFNTNILLQYMPFIALAFVSIIILALFIYFFKEFKTLKEVAEAMHQAAVAISTGAG